MTSRDGCGNGVSHCPYGLHIPVLLIRNVGLCCRALRASAERRVWFATTCGRRQVTIGVRASRESRILASYGHLSLVT